MWKYIAKRLLLCFVILFGVSVIIYTMVRLMPTDYVDKKFAPQLAQGTVTQADINRMKELYGLYVPDARITLKFDKSAKETFGKKAFTQTFDINSWEDKNEKTKNADWFKGEYTNDEYTMKLDVDYAGATTFRVTQTFSVYHDPAMETSNELYQDKDGVYVLYPDLTGKLFKVYRSEYGKKSLVADNGFVYVDGDDAKTHVGTMVAERGTNKPAAKKQIEGFDADKFSYTATSYPNLVTKGTYKYIQSEDKIVFNIDGKEISSVAVKCYKLNGWHKLGCILDGYFTWLGNFCKGDLGQSFKYSQPVADVIKKDMWVSFSISLIALILEFAIAIPLGILSATHQYGPLDYIVTILAMMGISLPSFFLGKLLIAFFAKTLGWFPVDGWITPTLPVDASGWRIFWDHAYHAVLPMMVLVILSIGGLMRYTRTNMLEVLNSDYIRTARAKGLSEKTVIYKHAFKNTMIPLVTILAGTLPGLFGGAMITEQVFSLPGIGNKAYKALIDGDVPFIMGYNMFLAVLSVVGILMSDLMYMMVDPRVKIAK